MYPAVPLYPKDARKWITTYPGGGRHSIAWDGQDPGYSDMVPFVALHPADNMVRAIDEGTVVYTACDTMGNFEAILQTGLFTYYRYTNLRITYVRKFQDVVAGHELGSVNDVFVIEKCVRKFKPFCQHPIKIGLFYYDRVDVFKTVTGEAPV